MFREHPDGLIYINNKCLKLEDFLSFEPSYQSVGCREYKPGEHHRIFCNGSQTGGEMPWTEGDQYLAKEAEYTMALMPLEPLQKINISKLEIVSRLEGIGKLNDALALLNADPIRLAKWNAAVEIAISDIDVRSMLNSISVNPDEILY